ncbi:amidohydrolase [Fodinibius halophilus]|uniref:Amidohydrolase n=1 Tax=Fodinibius halophilus TaxID=1736908 RepID=A0A6M1SZN5_9BACT|nr:amidohydrolase [Fodinibius halophilus]NGP89328.1 amidohydrolase [Fodinibius halophilus]
MSIIRFPAILLVLFAFISFSCQKSDKTETTVIENVKGYTFYDGDLKEFSAIAFENGKVIDVYSDTTFKSNGSTKIIDGDGKVMLPGLIDAHGHVMGLGFQQMNADLTGTQSLDEALSKVEEYAAKYSDINWVQGRGWNHTHWDIGRFPTAEELDKAENERPVWLARVDGHAGWANSKAMELAGITAETKAPKGGKIIRDEDGEPTGVFVDAAMSLVEAEIPEPTDKERKLAFEKALQQMRSHGLTGAHDAGVSVEAWELYKDFADNGKLTTRIYGMISGAGETFDKLSEGGPVNSYADDKLALRSVKLYSDGALGSRGAAMIEPYSDDQDNKGLLFLSEEELTGKILKTASAGYQANVHAIGDRANRVALNSFENVKDSLGEQGLRHRVEHAQIVSPKDIPRFKELNIIASMQPTHATSDMNMAEDRVGAERIKGGYAWQTFWDQGTVVASGSDFPVENVNPFYGLYSAITRQDHQGNPEGGWYPSERLSRAQALKSFTLNAAYAGHQEEVLGSLEPGKWADFILVDRDIFEVPAIEIWETKVLESWVAGEQVYSAEQ